MRSKRILSFKYAYEGIRAALIEEPNLKFHFLVALVTVLTGIYLGLNRLEWISLMIVIGMVISLELTNAAIEAVVDSFTDKQHPGAKLAKDISAGAVLIAAITSVIVGLIIFLPYLT